MSTKLIKYIFAGIVFGIIMTKSEAISWFRIQEMFRFHSFHMYGIIGSALFVGLIGMQVMKKRFPDLKALGLKPKQFGITRYLLGGTIFGLGWALTGACPGPIFVLIGHGYSIILLLLFSAVLGTFTYGLLRDRLPH
ncbi:MAG: DUF6691 family protein [Bacteroidota bacterium]